MTGNLCVYRWVIIKLHSFGLGILRMVSVTVLFSDWEEEWYPSPARGAVAANALAGESQNSIGDFEWWCWD
jgi:hypothetical protein